MMSHFEMVRAWEGEGSLLKRLVNAFIRSLKGHACEFRVSLPFTAQCNGARPLSFAPRWTLLTVTALSLGLGPLAFAATFTVNDTGDAVDNTPGDGQCRTAAGGCTLRAAVMEANTLPGGDVIDLPAGTYPLTIAGAEEDAGATGDLDIRGDLTIQGAGADTTSIEGGPDFRDRIIHVHSGTVEIAGVTVRNGTVVGSGGGLRNQSGDPVTLRNCSIVGNRTTAPEVPDTEPGVELTQSGGGIFNTGTLRLIGCTVIDNVAVAHGGGIASDTRRSSLILEQDFLIEGNVTVRGSGGGIFINRGGLMATDGRVSNNKSGDPNSPDFHEPVSSDAGGIGTDKGSSHASLTNVVLQGNSSLEDGGAIENEAGTMELTNCVVEENRTVGRLTPAGIPDGQGGGIENDRGTMTIRNSRIVNNFSATSAGGIHNANGTLHVIQSTIAGNSAQISGGGIYNRENPYIDAETGKLNTELDPPKPVRNSELTIIGSTLSGNAAVVSPQAPGSLELPEVVGGGGGIFNGTSATATISNSTISSNTVKGINQYFNGNRGSAIENAGTLSVSHSTIARNFSNTLSFWFFHVRAGAIVIGKEPGSEFTISNTILDNSRNCRFSELRSAGFNLSTDNSCGGLDQPGDQVNVPSGLDPAGLRDNGGPTQTIALLPGSRAVDQGTAGDNAEDQRGAARVNFPDVADAAGGDGSDIGAFELQMP